MRVECRPHSGVRCSGGADNGTRFQLDSLPCRFETGYRLDVALGLSIFLGVLGLDRFYLGYVALGLFKLFTLGGCTVLAMFDVVFLATGWLQPADGSDLVTWRDGPRLHLRPETDVERFWADVNWVDL